MSDGTAAGFRAGCSERGGCFELTQRTAGATAPDRVDPVALLEEQARTRVPEFVPIPHERMLVSPFTFYRDAALLMAADLAGTPERS